MLEVQVRVLEVHAKLLRLSCFDGPWAFTRKSWLARHT